MPRSFNDDTAEIVWEQLPRLKREFSTKLSRKKVKPTHECWRSSCNKCIHDCRVIKKAATLEKTILSLQREKRKQEIGAYHTEVDAVNSIIASLETQVKRLHMEKGNLNQGALVFILFKDYIHMEISF